MEKLQSKEEPVSRLKSTLVECQGRWEAGQVEWVENEEMVLEETRGRVKELTKASDDRNSKERQFFSCEAVLWYETTYNVEVQKHENHKLFRSYELGLKSSFKGFSISWT